MAGFFDNRYKFPIHIVQIIICVGVLILSVVRMLNQPANAPKGRSNTMSMGMAAKSLIIMLYQMLSDHVRSFQRWRSYKAYFILNALEIVFWAAVTFMMIQANIKFCTGLSCTLSWIVVILAIVNSTFAFYMTIVTWLDWRYYKENGVPRGHKYAQGDAVEVRSIDSGDDERGRQRKDRNKSDYLMAQYSTPSPGRGDSRSPSQFDSRAHGYHGHHDPRNNAYGYQQGYAGFDSAESYDSYRAQNLMATQHGHTAALPPRRPETTLAPGNYQ